MDTITVILKLINDNGISAAELSRKIGLTNGLITQWKQGKQKPSLDNLEKIADFFNVSIDYLMMRTENINPTQKDPLSLLDNESNMSEERKKKLQNFIEKAIALDDKEFNDMIKFANRLLDTDN